MERRAGPKSHIKKVIYLPDLSQNHMILRKGVDSSNMRKKPPELSIRKTIKH